MLHRKTERPRGVLKLAETETTGLVHERFLPSDDLAPYVEHYWRVAWDRCDLGPMPVATLPHPSVHMTFSAPDGGIIGGPARARFTRELNDVGEVFAVKFRPGGFHPFAAGPVSRFTDITVPVATVFGPDGAALAHAVVSAGETAGRVALTEAFLRAQQPIPDACVARAAELVLLVMREPGIVKVADLVARAGVGMRTLQRLFAEYVGVGPKWVIQRYRLHEAAERLAAGPVDHSALALEVGYSDQAHFIRDFKAIVGVTPAAYARRACPETSHPD